MGLKFLDERQLLNMAMGFAFLQAKRLFPIFLHKSRTASGSESIVQPVAVSFFRGASCEITLMQEAERFQRLARHPGIHNPKLLFEVLYPQIHKPCSLLGRQERTLSACLIGQFLRLV